MIELTPVENSSAIMAQGYDKAQGVLRIQYKSGAVHDFQGVSAEDAAGLVSAESAGRYLNSVIKATYQSELVVQSEEG